jgi:hypothetical protein
MADYIFNIYLHTNRGEFSEDYSLSEYSFNLPPFYFTLNEFVSAKASIDIVDSSLSCTGTNTYYASSALFGLSQSECEPRISTIHLPTTIYAHPDSKAVLIVSSVKYVDITDSVYANSHAIGTFTQV